MLFGVFGVFGAFGLLLLFMGLARLFGRSRLTISRERITFRTTLLGIVSFCWKTVRTADVIGVGPTKRPITGPPTGHVIRTASRGIFHNDQFRDVVRNAAEANWLAGEIALRIQAARPGASLPPIRHRSSQERY
jgi:hypothetical protein